MSTLSRRVQILLTDAQYTELENEARSQKKSIGTIVRRALEEHLGEREQAERIQAVRQLGALHLPVSDWEQMERESVGAADAE